MAMNRWTDASRDLEEAVSQDPNAASYLRLARSLLMGGDRGAAQAALRKAQNSGLTLAELHPLERPVYEKILQDLEKKSVH
jgi:uncharacterized protein HemY